MPNINIDLQVTDESPYFQSTCDIKEDEKPMIDKMQRLVHLGILKQDMSPYSSPITIHHKNEFKLEKNHGKL